MDCKEIGAAVGGLVTLLPRLVKWFIDRLSEKRQMRASKKMEIVGDVCFDPGGSEPFCKFCNSKWIRRPLFKHDEFHGELLVDVEWTNLKCHECHEEFQITPAIRDRINAGNPPAEPGP